MIKDYDYLIGLAGLPRYNRERVEAYEKAFKKLYNKKQRYGIRQKNQIKKV